jgi:acyl-CoA thioesterase FadM
VSGIIRNLLTLISAFLAFGKLDPWSQVTSYFWVSPFDSGTSVLKSDKYLQFAEAAQLDFLVKTRLLGTLVRRGLRFVNAAQLVKFASPIGMLKRVRVETKILFADEKCIYFSHSLFLGKKRHGEVLVKMKFKNGSITIRPSDLIGTNTAPKPIHVVAWDQTLDVM